jgi:hypothetical protein
MTHDRTICVNNDIVFRKVLMDNRLNLNEPL